MRSECFHLRRGGSCPLPPSSLPAEVLRKVGRCLFFCDTNALPCRYFVLRTVQLGVTWGQTPKMRVFRLVFLSTKDKWEPCKGTAHLSRGAFQSFGPGVALTQHDRIRIVADTVLCGLTGSATMHSAVLALTSPMGPRAPGDVWHMMTWLCHFGGTVLIRLPLAGALDWFGT